MGLDIHAFKRVGKFLNADEQHWFPENYFQLYNIPEFRGRAPEIRHLGFYEVSKETFHFRAGSYSGYNRWREWLCETFIETTTGNVWDNPEAYKDKPFVELVNFSDCEGTIGNALCKKLLEDFEYSMLHPWFSEEHDFRDKECIEIFKDFDKAFCLAASTDTGVVVFS